MKKIFAQLLFVLAFFLSTKICGQGGTLDPTFIVGTGANGSVVTTAIQSDGKIIIGGYFSSYNGTARNRIARLNTDGTLDSSFNVGTGLINYILTCAIQADGKIIIGGNFSSYNGRAVSNIARLNADGSLDATFNIGSGTNGDVKTIAIQANGKIIIGGNFRIYNNRWAGLLIRLNTDGSMDTSFHAGLFIYDGHVFSIVIQNDGKLIIGGNFYGTIFNGIARLYTDGSPDASFNVGTGISYPGYINTISIQNDGKIIIGGFFTTYNGVAKKNIARLNTNGSLDMSFKIGTGADNYVLTTAIQCDRRIIIGGLFTKYNGTVTDRLARLNTDGSLDASFYVDNTVRTTAIQSDGKIIIGGSFTSYNGTSRNCIVRLSTTCNCKITYSDTCFSNNTKFSISNLVGGDSIRWNFNDPISGTFNNSTLLNPDHKFTSSGSYNVSATVYSCNSSSTVSKQLLINPTPQINLGNDTTLCTGDSLKLNVNSGFNQYLWSNNSTNNNIIVKTSGKYWAKVTDNGCANSDTINISYLNSLNLGNDTTLCADTSYTLNPGASSNSKYLWSDGSSTSSITAKNSGIYWVRASNGQCVSSDTINLIFDGYKNMSVTASKDTVNYSEGIQFTARGNNIVKYTWDFNDGSTSNIQNPSHVFMESGDYNVIAQGTNINNCTITKNLSIVVREILIIPNLFTPNKDNLNDDFKILYNGKEPYQLEIYNRWGRQIFISKDKSVFWDGKDESEGIYYYNLSIGSAIYKGWVELLK